MNHKLIKSDIRNQIRKKRNAVTPSQNLILGAELNQQLIKHKLLEPHQHITCFLSFDGEVSTEQVIQYILDSNKNCYLPKLQLKTESTPNRLQFLRYKLSSKMAKNHYGIPEVDSDDSIEIEKLDLVLFPLVAFDLNGNRLGMGGGFYDATFTTVKNLKNRPRFIGLAHDFQQVHTVPREKWDLPLDGICTPSRFIEFS